MASIIDNQFRNRIAHLDFEVKGNDILIDGKPAIVDAILGLRRLFVAVNEVETILTKLSTDRKLRDN